MEYFIALAEELHFGRAAKRLNISQPPLSQQIKQLEKNMEVTLFNRTKHKVELTNSGKVFLEDAYKIMDSIDQAVKKTIKAEKGESGELTLGFTSNSIYDVLPEILSEFYKYYPSINIVVKQMSTSEQVQALNDEKLQAGLLCPPIDKKNLFMQEIYEQSFIAVLPTNHPLNNSEKSIRVKDLNKYPFIMTPRDIGPGYYDNVINICFDVGFSPNIVQEATDLHTCISLVSAGLGVSLVPTSLKQYQKEGVVYKNIENNKTITTAAAWKKNNASNILNNFLEIISNLNFQSNI